VKHVQPRAGAVDHSPSAILRSYNSVSPEHQSSVSVIGIRSLPSRKQRRWKPSITRLGYSSNISSLQRITMPSWMQRRPSSRRHTDSIASAIFRASCSRVHFGLVYPSAFFLHCGDTLQALLRREGNSPGTTPRKSPHGQPQENPFFRPYDEHPG
jgi:hypothetical protein